MRGRLWSPSLSEATDIALLVEAATRGIKATYAFAQIWSLSSWSDSIKNIACNDLYGTIKVCWRTNYLCVVLYFWDCNLIMFLPLLSLLNPSIYVLLNITWWVHTMLIKMQNCGSQSQWILLQNIPTPKPQARLQKRGWKDFIGQWIGGFLWDCVSL